jgi:acyl-CoA reductase-like NAD-dependent aldehyde dehydrogenase
MGTVKLPAEQSMLIGGERVAAHDGRTLETTNPATGEVLATIPRGGEADVEDAVRVASEAFPAWRDKPPVERVAALNALADRIEENAEQLGLIDVAENGSPIREMRKDAWVAAWLIRHLAGLTLRVWRDDAERSDAVQLFDAAAVRGGRSHHPVQPSGALRRQPARGAAGRR